jgi:thioredoxin
MSDIIIPGTESEARAILGSDGAPVLVDIYAEWCGPCKAFAPTLERFAAESRDAVRVMKLDIEEFTGVAGEIGIRSVPTLLVVRSGQVVADRSAADDDGQGIAPERLHALQDAIDCRQDSGPAGLGLTLASIVARAHKGHLRFAAGGCGTRIELSFETVSSPAAPIADAGADRSESAVLPR